MTTENKKETTKKTTKKKTTTKKVEEVKQEMVQQTQPQMTMEQMQQMMMNMMQMMSAMQQNQVVQTPVVEETAVKEVKKEEKINKKKWSKIDLYDIADEKILVTSVSENIVYHAKKTGIVYRWPHIGDSEIFTVSELINMDNTSKRFLRTPWLKVSDERIIEALGLGELYTLLEKVEDIDMLVSMSTPEIERVFERLPKEYKEDFRDNVVKKIRNKELRDLAVIEVLSDVLDTDLKNI